MSKKLIQDIITRAVSTVRKETVHHEHETDTGGSGHRARFGTGRKFLVSASLVILGVVVVMGIFLVFSSSFSRVSLKIETSKKTVDVNDSIVLTSKGNVPGSLKYDLMKLEDSESVNVATTGTKTVSKNAVGTVTFYNSGKTIQKLVAGTRLESPDGKIFKIDKAVAIPAAKTLPGSIDVTIHASAPGAAYNLAPTEFRVPGLKGGAKYDLVKAVSHKNFTGGFTGEIKTVSPLAIEKARAQLREVITQKLTKNALLQVPKGFILYNDAMFFSFSDNSLGGSALANTSSGDSALKMTGTLNSLIIDQNELKNQVVIKDLQDQASGASFVVFGLDKLIFKIVNKDRVILDGAQQISASLSGPVSVVWDFDEKLLRSKLSGIEKSKYQEVFKSFPTVEKAEATFSPSWALYFPSDVSRITIDKGF